MIGTRTLPLYVFCSGACALLYQTVWQREFRLIFGASTAASGAVLAAFIGGLGAGSLLLARRVEASPKPFKLYAQFELGIAISTAVTPLLLSAVRSVYWGIGGTQALGDVFGTTLRVVLSAAVIFIPTFLMGGTLPAVARAITDESDAGRRHVAVLYGVNTIGAVLGCGLATSVLLEVLGNRGALWVGCLVNALVALAALSKSRTLPDVPAAAAEAPAAAPTVDVPRNLVLGAAFVVGAVFFVMELVWFRMLSPLLGGSVFTFGVVLCVALAGIGLGGAFAGRLARGGPPTVLAFAMTCLLEALALALPFAFGDAAAFFALVLRPVAMQGLAGSAAAWTAVCLFVVFPAAFVSGVQFPLLIALAGRARQEVARHVGLVYAANTVGSVVGSLAGGFGLIPWLSAPGVWRLATAALIAVGLAALVVARRGAGQLKLAMPVGVAVLAAACIFTTGPTAVWRHTPIGAGRVPTDVVLPANRDAWVRAAHRDTVWEQDGVEVAVALNATDGLAFVVSGKVDGNALGDVATQVMSGILGALLHPQPKTALVIGLGTGSTAGWLAQVPSLERVDVMELEPAILEVARKMPEINQDVMASKKVRHLLGDARELLATSREKYDVLFSEPSNPYRAGIANLYTKEFYEAARDHLQDDGVFIQFLQSYEVDGAVIQGVYATLRTVFGSVETWCGNSGDLLLVGSKAPIRVDVARLRSLIAAEPFATALRIGWGVDSAEGVFAHHVAGPDFTQWLIDHARPEVNTDDANRIEFGFARSVGAQVHQRADLSALATAFHQGKSPLPEGLDPSLLKVESFVFTAGARTRSGTSAAPPAGFTPAEAGRARAIAAFSRGDLPDVAAAWPPDTAPASTHERLVKLAAAFKQPAETRAADAAALAALYPVEVELIEAFAALAHGDEEGGLARLEKAFVTHRTVPWASPGLVRRALAAASAEGKPRPWYQRVAVALEKPFAAAALEAERMDTLLRVVALSGDGEACARAYETLGDAVPWTKQHLGVRLACYEALRPALVDRARRDWERFNAQQPRMVSSGLSP